MPKAPSRELVQKFAVDQVDLTQVGLARISGHP